MDKILLSALLNGKIQSQELRSPMSDIYCKLLDEETEKSDYLKSKLSEEDKKDFDRICDIRIQCNSIDEDDMFLHGLQTGAFLMLEIFGKHIRWKGGRDEQ